MSIMTKTTLTFNEYCCLEYVEGLERDGQTREYGCQCHQLSGNQQCLPARSVMLSATLQENNVKMRLK